MAHEVQLGMLKRNVDQWNLWKKQHQNEPIDLTNANLSGIDLTNADLGGADLSRAYLNFAILRGATLKKATLRETILTGADLTNADLSEADLSDSYIGWTHFDSLDLHQTKGLETVVHIGPSFISTSTLEQSEGDIPEVFLERAGLKRPSIDYALSLTSTSNTYPSCFLSFSSKDTRFVDRLNTDLKHSGVSCWSYNENLEIGRFIQKNLIEAIQQHDRILLVLSKNSIESREVRNEVQIALDKEKEVQKMVLIPIYIDRVALESQHNWVGEIYERNVGDFSNWEMEEDYQNALARLLKNLESIYMKEKKNN